MGVLGLAYPNRVIGAAVSGGSWLSALPAANAATRELAEVARSTNANTSSTKLLFDLGAARTLRAFALVNHNLSSAATWLVKLGTTSGGSDVYSGSATNAWQLGSFDATVTALGVDDGQYRRSDYAAILVLATSYSARYLSVEISDSGNAAGYVQVGMVFASGLWVPAMNPEYGTPLHGHDDLSSRAQAESGAEYATARRRLKTAEFLLPHLSATEGDQLHEMQRVLGSVDDVLYVPDVDDAAAQQRYGFLGRAREMRPIEYPFYAGRAKGVALRERGA